MYEAKGYLNAIRKIRSRLQSADNELRAIDEELYSLHGTDYSKAHVSGSATADITDRIDRANKKREKVNRRIILLEETKDEAEERISCLQDQESASYLIDYYIACMTIDEIMRRRNYARSSVYNHLHKAEREFQKTYDKWLKSIDKIFWIACFCKVWKNLE